MKRSRRWQAQSLFLQPPKELRHHSSRPMGRLPSSPSLAWPKSELNPLGRPPEFNLSQVGKVKEVELSNGIDGNLETIQIMKEKARIRSGHPLIRKFALNILQEYRVPSHHFVQEALAIGDYIKKKVRYVRDPHGIEYLTDPIDLVKNIQNGTAQGDCDDMALLTASLLLSVGVQPFFRAVRYNSSQGNYNHIYVVVYEKNPYGKKERIVLDCILKDKPIGTEVNHISGEEYSA